MGHWESANAYIIDVVLDIYKRILRMQVVASGSKIYLTTTGKIYLDYSQTLRLSGSFRIIE